MGRTSKLIGSAFERLICERLSVWFSEGRRKDLFWRSAMSGGRALPSCAGDISAIEREGCPLTETFVIECKHVKGHLFEPLVFYQKSQVVNWWLKVCDEADEHGRLPMLIVQQTGKKEILVCVCEHGRMMMDLDGVRFPQFPKWMYVFTMEAALRPTFRNAILRRRVRIRIPG